MKNNYNKHFFLLILLAFFACKDEEVPTIVEPDTTVTSIEIISSKVIFSLGIDTELLITAVAKNATGETLNNDEFTWASSNEAVATIDDNGLLTILNEGTTDISATIEDVMGVLNVSVQVPEIALVAPQIEFILGALGQPPFHMEIGGQFISNSEVQWASSNEAIAIINSNGIITAISTGQTDISATYIDNVYTISVTIVGPSLAGDYIFLSDNTTLRATVNLPAGIGPFPAVVLIHGSGTATRSTLQVFSDKFTDNGIAALIYDKRGTGQSGGTFFEIGPSENGVQRTKQLGRDAIAALEFLRQHTQIQNEHVGLFGWSQAGWIIPSAAAQASNVDFMVNVVGPVCSVGEEIYYSNLISGGMSVDEANIEVANYTGPHGYEPVADLEQITIPSLWSLGGKDTSIPTQVTLDRLNVLINNGKSQFDIHYYPNGNHFLIDIVTGQQIGYLTGSGGAIDWIKETIQ